jgi:N-acetylneuraminate synthase/sialic acid synthase
VHWDEVLGARLTRSVSCEELLDWDALALEQQSATMAGRS